MQIEWKTKDKSELFQRFFSLCSVISYYLGYFPNLLLVDAGEFFHHFSMSFFFFVYNVYIVHWVDFLEKNINYKFTSYLSRRAVM